MFNKKIIFISIIVYFALRVFSYFFSPPTPLVEGSIINTALSILLAITAGYLIIINDWRGWLIIAGEILLGGSGNILSIESISIRSVLLVLSITIFTIQIIAKGQLKNVFLKPITIPICLIIIWSIVSSIIGFQGNHNINLVISDFIPYLFILYYFPLSQLLKNENFKKACFNILFAGIMANAFFILATFILFNFQIAQLQDAFYHWFRDVAGGKITYLSDGFFRLVLNEHLMAIPIALYFLYLQIRQSKNINLLALIALSIILAISLTRIYYLALIVSLFFLYTKQHCKLWLKYSAFFLASIFIFYTGIYLFASRGINLGWEYFGLRIGSIAAPQIEDSSLSRMVLLPEIIEKIKQKPIIGHGLGDTVTIMSPVYNDFITTPHFDWGYLEIISETGIIGLMIWILLFIYLFYLIIKNYKTIKSPFLAMIIALLVMNLTSPAIFHVMGVILIAISLACVLKQSPGELFDNPKPPEFSKAI